MQTVEEKHEDVMKRAQDYLGGILKKNRDMSRISEGVWITDNYLFIFADMMHPLVEPWSTISQYIVGWYRDWRVKKASEGSVRPIHITIVLDCYKYPGTLVFTVNGSPPKGRLVVELDSYSVPPEIVAVTFIGARVRKISDLDRLPRAFRESLNEAVRLVLSKWLSERLLMNNHVRGLVVDL